MGTPLTLPPNQLNQSTQSLCVDQPDGSVVYNSNSPSSMTFRDTTDATTATTQDAMVQCHNYETITNAAPSIRNIEPLQHFLFKEFDSSNHDINLPKLPYELTMLSANTGEWVCLPSNYSLVDGRDNVYPTKEVCQAEVDKRNKPANPTD